MYTGIAKYKNSVIYKILHVTDLVCVKKGDINNKVV